MRRWYTWDRNPSEPNFRDWTNLGYDNDTVHRFEDTLDFSLTSFLNEAKINFKPGVDDITPIANAYKRFNTEAGEIYTNTEKKIKLLEEGRKIKIKQLGQKIAQELKQ